MTDKIQQARRAAFEAYVVREHGNPALNKNGDYFCDITHGAWLGFNAALDCVVIELPEKFVYCSTVSESSYDLAVDECADAIELTSLGLRVK